jgi:hypothetical protein
LIRETGAAVFLSASLGCGCCGNVRVALVPAAAGRRVTTTGTGRLPASAGAARARRGAREGRSLVR